MCHLGYVTPVRMCKWHKEADYLSIHRIVHTIVFWGSKGRRNFAMHCCSSAGYTVYYTTMIVDQEPDLMH